MSYIIDHIPKNTPHNRRSGIRMVPNTITIHNTGNPKSTARNERDWLTNPKNDRQASFHLVVDEREIIECIPLNEVAYHAGAREGNNTSIGIEICESGNYAKNVENAVELTAKLLKERGWGIERLRRHFDWSGKICPRLMYDGGSWTSWEGFKRQVLQRLEQLNKEAAKVEDNKLNIQIVDIFLKKHNKTVKGIMINGVSYLPNREVAECYGEPIEWDSKNKRVVLG